MNPAIASIASALPPHRVSQTEIRQAALAHFSRLRKDARRLIAVFDNVQVNQRHLCVPLDWFERERSFSETNSEYIKCATRLSRQAIESCLKRADVKAQDIDHIIFVSTSGMSTPSIDAYLINQIGFRGNIKRTPVFGLGCAGGAAGLSRLRDLALGADGQKLLLVTVELCSLTFQFKDFSKANLVASSLFSDGAAAVLIDPARPAQGSPVILDTQSTIWSDTLDVMGWDFSETGLQVVFSREIPNIIAQRLRENVEQFLTANGLTLADIRHFIVHPGGAKILASFRSTFDLEEARLEHSRHILENCGNMSSPTLLFILERHCKTAEISAGDYGLCVAFGPGFSSELLLLRWE